MSQSSCSSVSDDQEDYYEYLYDGVDEADTDVINCDSEQFEFHQAIELFKQNYPFETVTFRHRDSIQEVEISFSMSLNNLKGDVLMAWGLIKDLPISVDLLFAYPRFSEGQEKPKVLIYQGANGNTSSVLVQLQSIVEAFCRQQLKSEDFKWTPANCDSSSTSDERNPEQTSARDVDSTDFTTYVSSENAKRIPQTSQGFLVQLYLYMQQRLLSLNDFCPLCDERHDIGTSTSMLKPMVCEKPLCIFSSQTIGVRSNVVECLKLQPKVVHFLLATTVAALFTKRHKLTFQPSIEVSNLHSGYKQTPSVPKCDSGILQEALCAMPLVDDMVTKSEKDLKNNLNSCHDLCYPLLRWIINSNRSHIITLPKDKQIGFMVTDLQFLLCNSPPIEDANFRALVKKHGSIFAFHGSPAYNWHSILRKGLLVGSGTERELHGKVHGKGIYLSPKLKLACSYCGTDEQYKEHDKYRIKFCLALCEVVNIPGLKKAGKGTIWICPDSKFVCTRFLFGYEYMKMAEIFRTIDGIDVSDPVLIKDIEASLDGHRF